MAISTSANSIAERVLKLVGHPEVVAEPWFATGRQRAKHADLLSDLQVQSIGMTTTVDDADLGAMQMQNVMWRMSETPGNIRHTGRAHGADTVEILHDLGLDDTRIAALHARIVV